MILNHSFIYKECPYSIAWSRIMTAHKPTQVRVHKHTHTHNFTCVCMCVHTHTNAITSIHATHFLNIWLLKTAGTFLQVKRTDEIFWFIPQMYPTGHLFYELWLHTVSYPLNATNFNYYLTTKKEKLQSDKRTKKTFWSTNIISRKTKCKVMHLQVHT
jgi:hypothetical protein